MAVNLCVGGFVFATSAERVRETLAAVGTPASASIARDRASAGGGR